MSKVNSLKLVFENYWGLVCKRGGGSNLTARSGNEMVIFYF